MATPLYRRMFIRWSLGRWQTKKILAKKVFFCHSKLILWRSELLPSKEENSEDFYLRDLNKNTQFLSSKKSFLSEAIFDKLFGHLLMGIEPPTARLQIVLASRYVTFASNKWLNLHFITTPTPKTPVSYTQMKLPKNYFIFITRW